MRAVPGKLAALGVLAWLAGCGAGPDAVLPASALVGVRPDVRREVAFTRYDSGLFGWKRTRPQRFRLVVCQPPDDDQRLLALRCVVLPGETVDIEGGSLRIDGAALQLPPALDGVTFVPDGSEIEYPYTVPERSYLLFGDHAEALDGRRFGAVPGKRCVGRVLSAPGDGGA